MSRAEAGERSSPAVTPTTPDRTGPVGRVRDAVVILLPAALVSLGLHLWAVMSPAAQVNSDEALHRAAGVQRAARALLPDGRGQRLRRRARVLPDRAPAPRRQRHRPAQDRADRRCPSSPGSFSLGAPCRSWAAGSPSSPAPSAGSAPAPRSSLVDQLHGVRERGDRHGRDPRLRGAPDDPAALDWRSVRGSAPAWPSGASDLRHRRGAGLPPRARGDLAAAAVGRTRRLGAVRRRPTVAALPLRPRRPRIAQSDRPSTYLGRVRIILTELLPSGFGLRAPNGLWLEPVTVTGVVAGGAHRGRPRGPRGAAARMRRSALPFTVAGLGAVPALAVVPGPVLQRRRPLCGRVHAGAARRAVRLDPRPPGLGPATAPPRGRRPGGLGPARVRAVAAPLGRLDLEDPNTSAERAVVDLQQRRITAVDGDYWTVYVLDYYAGGSSTLGPTSSSGYRTTWRGPRRRRPTTWPRPTTPAPSRRVPPPCRGPRRTTGSSRPAAGSSGSPPPDRRSTGQTWRVGRAPCRTRPTRSDSWYRPRARPGGRRGPAPTRPGVAAGEITVGAVVMRLGHRREVPRGGLAALVDDGRATAHRPRPTRPGPCRSQRSVSSKYMK